MVLEYYLGKLIKKDNQYMVHHIDSICNAKDSTAIDTKDSYVARLKGYCSPEDAMKKINSSNSQLANDIKDIIICLNNDDYLLVECDELIAM